jgi:peptide/nickel transport system substrate-binding protein
MKITTPLIYVFYNNEEGLITMKKLLILLLVLTFSIGGLAGCGGFGATPLVVGYSQFSEKFSPFFSDTAYDADVAAMTQVALLTTDRTGAIVYNAIEGETLAYNGTDYVYKGPADLKVDYDKEAGKTTYLWTIRDDILFSDGEPMTADDIIFSYYAYCDPSYDGSSTVYSVPIVGLQNYRTQTTDTVYAKYDKLFDTIYKTGADYTVKASDGFTQEQHDNLFKIIDEVWKEDVQSIVNVCLNDYIDMAPDYFGGRTADAVMADENLHVAFGMALWGYGTAEEDGSLTSAVLGKKWNLTDQFPTIDDYLAEAKAAYENDPVAYWAVEAPDDTDVYETARQKFISSEGPKDPELGGKGIPNIVGIEKLSDTQVQITTDGYDAAAVYTLGIQVAPLHYYGSADMYDYEANKFGFTFGDLSSIRDKTTTPMGAGPYKFVKYDKKIVYFEANENYYKGEPKTKNMQFKETADADKISGISTGTIDITDPSYGTAGVEEISGYNSNGEVTGDVITTNTVNNLGYGYVGINAKTVKVGNDSDSDASKALRKGLATVIASYRNLTVDSYYGESASVINYPISDTSWAAPKPTDDGYKVAFSTAADGKDIYTSDMDADAKYAAALEAAKQYFIKAGYTYNSATGKFTAAPKGASLEYEIIIPADGSGDHPSFMLCTKFKEAMATIGFNIIINDPSDANVLWDALDADTNELWCAAWGATIDPDMYQIYHSDDVTGSNNYGIADSKLDELIIKARTSDDQAFRKATYKACLDIIIDWAVEVPIYQRQNCIIFSTERVNMDTVTPDITTFWVWWNDIELLEMK